MIRFNQRDVLWIVRGIRLGRFLLRCGQTVRRAREAIRQQPPADPAAPVTEQPATLTTTAAPAAARGPVRRPRAKEDMPYKVRKAPALDPATLTPGAGRQLLSSRLDH